MTYFAYRYILVNVRWSTTQRKDTTMTTKEQERKAVEKIEKIIAELGADSYVGKAFEGCADIARQNIDFDFMQSMRDRYFSEQERANEEAVKKAQLTKELENLRELREQMEETYGADYEKIVKEYEEYRRNAELEKDELEAEISMITERHEETKNNYRDKCNEVSELTARNAAQAQEIIELKAKLYDLMVAK